MDFVTKAQDAFSYFYDFFRNTFENIFWQEFVEIKYKNSWMPNSFVKSIHNNHILYKLRITNSTEANKMIYKTYHNKVNSIKRKAECEYFSTQLEIWHRIEPIVWFSFLWDCNTLLKSDVTRRDHVSVVMDPMNVGSRIVNFIVNFIRDGTVFA